MWLVMPARSISYNDRQHVDRKLPRIRPHSGHAPVPELDSISFKSCGCSLPSHDLLLFSRSIGTSADPNKKKGQPSSELELFAFAWNVLLHRTLGAIGRVICIRLCILLGGTGAAHKLMTYPNFNHPVGRDAARSELKRAFCSSLSEL